VYLKKGVGVRVAKNYGNIEVKHRHAFCLFLFFQNRTDNARITGREVKWLCVFIECSNLAWQLTAVALLIVMPSRWFVVESRKDEPLLPQIARPK